jgi:hypothetical protein
VNDRREENQGGSRAARFHRLPPGRSSGFFV